MPKSPQGSTARRRIRLLIRAVSAAALVTSGFAIADTPAHAANEPSTSG